MVDILPNSDYIDSVRLIYWRNKMDWIMYTVGVVSHAWALLTIVGISALLNMPDVKKGLRKVEINGKFYIPWIGVLAFWMWYFFG